MSPLFQELLKDYLHRTQPVWQWFLEWDQNMFKHINQDWTNPLFDQLMPFITDYHNTMYLLIALVLLIILKAKAKSVVIIVGCVVSIGLADATASQIIKPLVNRPRPQFTLSHVRLLVPPQGSPSFPSNHAANCFAAATFLGMLILGTGPFALALAALVGYSRVYVGVHYPLDVVGGALVGLLSGLLVYRLFNLVEEVVIPKRRRSSVPDERWRKKNYLNRP